MHSLLSIMASNSSFWNGSSLANQRLHLNVRLESCKTHTTSTFPPNVISPKSEHKLPKMRLNKDALFSMRQMYDMPDDKWLKKVKYHDGSLAIDVNSFFGTAILNNARYAFTPELQLTFPKHIQNFPAISLWVTPEAFDWLHNKFYHNLVDHKWLKLAKEQIKEFGFLMFDIDPMFGKLVFALIKLSFLEDIQEMFSQQYSGIDVKNFNADKVDSTSQKFEKIFLDNRSSDNNNNVSGFLSSNLMSSKEDCCKIDGMAPGVDNIVKKQVVPPVRIVQLCSDEIKMKHFMEKIQVLVQEREKIMKDMYKSKGILNKNRDSVQFASLKKDINKLQKESEKISATILKKYKEYNSGDNLVLDLHGLMKNEVNIVLPHFFRCKLAQIGTKKKIAAKIITGIGTTIVNKRSSVIKDELLKFMEQKGLKFDDAGPGAFKVTISPDNQKSFSKRLF